jgi:hypothetical protein
MDKFYDTKLYQARNGTKFIILAEDFEHNKGYTEYLIFIIEDKGDFDQWPEKNWTDRFWVKSGQLIGMGISIIGDGEAVKVLYGLKK